MLCVARLPEVARQVSMQGMSVPSVNLYLVGFAGTGKSTVGRLLAQSLRFDFLDSDAEIERAQGRLISEIFAKEGETAFRQMERAFIEQGHPAQGCVVACGGGLIVPPGMTELLRARGVIICLHTTVETILERTSRATHRPLFEGEDREKRVRELYEQRAPLYQRAGTQVLVGGRPVREIVEHARRIYFREAREWRAPKGCL